MPALEDLMSGNMVVPPHTEQALKSPLTRLLQGIVSGVGNAVDFPRQYMEHGIDRGAAAQWAPEMAMNMVGAPMATTSTATLGSGATRAAKDVNALRAVLDRDFPNVNHWVNERPSGCVTTAPDPHWGSYRCGRTCRH